MLEELIRDKNVIFSASEAKLGSSFLVGQIMIKGYSTPFRLDGNQNGLLLYAREDITQNFLNQYIFEKPLENIYVEVNLRSRKWLLSCSYN